MAFLKEEFKQIKAFIFDVDGVLSADISHLNEDGDPIRTTNMKDGYAIRNAMNNGYEVAIITGELSNG
jgi:3-deoxy-D-manno-octulosonate 8-phosphate phosphatase (KDO 8-P phosphatase)